MVGIPVIGFPGSSFKAGKFGYTARNFCANQALIYFLRHAALVGNTEHSHTAGMETDPDRTRILQFILGSGSDPVSLEDVDPDLITFQLIVDVCQNIHEMLATRCSCILADPNRICISKFKSFSIRIGFGSLLVGSGSLPNLLI